MSTKCRYVLYHDIIYCAIGLSFSNNLNDYTFHLIDVELVQEFIDGINPNYELAIKAPIEECIELEGDALKIARLLYERE